MFSFYKKITFGLVFLSQLYSCTEVKQLSSKNEDSIVDAEHKKSETIEDIQFKNITTVIRFSASIEREIFKIIRPSLSPQMTQFEVISTVLDQSLGIKKNFGTVDCKLYRIKRNLTKIEIYKQCQKPEVLITHIDLGKDQMTLHYYTKEWSAAVGVSVALTAQDRICQIKFTKQKLNRMSCERTELLVDQSADIEELRLSEFIFDQSATDQVHVVGGFYKNLTEHRKLKINIPFDGKIKIIEKELNVRDDFAEPIAAPDSRVTQIIEQKPAEDSHGQKNDTPTEIGR